MERKYSERGLDLSRFRCEEKIIIEKPSLKAQELLGIEDVDKFMCFEDSVANDPDKFKKIDKFGFYNKKILGEILQSDKPLTALQKKAISNLAYEHAYFWAYFETVRESVRLFGNAKFRERTLKEVLGAALLTLRGHLSIWRWQGEAMRGDFLSLGRSKTKEEKDLAKKNKEAVDCLNLRDFKSFMKKNGNNISGALGDYYNLVDYDQELYGCKLDKGKSYAVTPEVKREALRLIKEKYDCFASEQSVKDCLSAVGVKGLPRLDG